MREKILTRICLFVTIAVFASIQTVHSDPITRQKALQNASEFLLKKGITLKNTALRHAPALPGSDSSENAPYYVFNVGDDNGLSLHRAMTDWSRYWAIRPQDTSTQRPCPRT